MLVALLGLPIRAAWTQERPSEVFAATATVKTAAGGTASAPLTLTINRKQSQAEADQFAAAFTSGGAAGLRKALQGVAPTGAISFGGGAPTPTRITIERTTDKGRLLTVVADKPILFLGAGLPDAKAKAGYDFAVLDLQVNASGSGAGTFAPAARITIKQGAFVVEDYGSELIRLASVKLAK